MSAVEAFWQQGAVNDERFYVVKCLLSMYSYIQKFLNIVNSAVVNEAPSLSKSHPALIRVPYVHKRVLYGTQHIQICQSIPPLWPV